MKIVINTCFGGFGISRMAAEMMGLTTEEKGLDSYQSYGYQLDRTDPKLISVVEQLGSKADGDGAVLKIVDIPDDMDYYIDEYGGRESIHEVHRFWR